MKYHRAIRILDYFKQFYIPWLFELLVTIRGSSSPKVMFLYVSIDLSKALNIVDQSRIHKKLKHRALNLEILSDLKGT